MNGSTKEKTSLAQWINAIKYAIEGLKAWEITKARR